MTVLRLLFVYSPWLAWQLTVSAVRLAVDVCTPTSTQRPRIVKLPLDDLTDLEVSLLTSSITITPGTLVLGVSPLDDAGSRAAFVHALFGDDESAVLTELEGMRDTLLSATRGGGGR